MFSKKDTCRAILMEIFTRKDLLYMGVSPIEGKVDTATFRLLDNRFGEDKDHIYYIREGRESTGWDSIWKIRVVVQLQFPRLFPSLCTVVAGKWSQWRTLLVSKF